MRIFMLLLSTLVAVTLLSSPGNAERRIAVAEPSTVFCTARTVHCVHTTNSKFIACQNLALARGWNFSRLDTVGREAFIYSCLVGRQR